MTQRFFLGGIPTGPDVDKLLKELDPKPGDRVLYSAVEIVIKSKPKSSRFRTVTGVWRKRLFRDRQLQSTADGEAFNFLNANDAQDTGVKNLFRIGRATGRLYRDVQAINAEELTGARIAQNRRLSRITEAMLDYTRSSAKEVVGPRSLPNQKRDLESDPRFAPPTDNSK